MAKRKTIEEKKWCPKCGRTLPLSRFYPNRGWAEQLYHDLWCKDCAARDAKGEEGLRKYCFENHREWSERNYDTAIKKAKNILSASPPYVNGSAEERSELEDKTITQCFFNLMNLNNFYKYVDNGLMSHPSDVPSREDLARDQEMQKKMEYSIRWRGYFTPEQIDILEDIYAQYDRDFDLSDVSLQDYAMKVAKASFHADQTYDRMRRGDATSSEYKDAQKIFDDLSKSSNFAACKRKPGEVTGMGSLGEIILRIEGTGKLNVDGDVWPQDSIDAVINEYRHALVAAGRDGAFG